VRRDEVLRNLKERGWLASCDPALRDAVIEAGRLLRFRRGEALYQSAGGPGGMFGVAEGGIVLSIPGRNRLPTAAHIVRPSSWFGYGSIFNRQRRMLIPVANEPSQALHLGLSELDKLRAVFPAADRAFWQLAMRGDAAYVAAISDLLIADTDRRLAAVLLRVTGAETQDRQKDLPIDPLLADPWAGPNGVPLTQALLGEMANASSQTVTRFVDRAVKAGWIVWTYGRVRILDFGQLLAFAACD
jgi:CRP/FNR family transcriptional regulator, cyclic AMP receptor protein